MTVDEQVGQIQRKLAERNSGSDAPVDRVDNPVWDIGLLTRPMSEPRPHDHPAMSDL
jgi:hypothetical protein